MTQDPEQLIYHYTDLAGLHGIIQSSTLWSSDPRDLNDTTEGSFAFESALDWVRAKHGEYERRGGGPGGFEEGIHRARLEDWGWYIAGDVAAELAYLKTSAAVPFVVCFCRDGDNLTMWRSYANDGLGFALGFDRLAMKAHGRIMDSTYEKCGRIPYLDDAWKTFEPKFLDPRIQSGSTSELIQPFLEEVYLGLLGVKHPAFADEREVRLIDERMEGRTVQFRAGALRRHAMVSFSKEMLRVIRVGPSAANSQSDSVLSEFLIRKGFGHTELAKSAVPYRGLTQLGLRG